MRQLDYASRRGFVGLREGVVASRDLAFRAEVQTAGQDRHRESEVLWRDDYFRYEYTCLLHDSDCCAQGPAFGLAAYWTLEGGNLGPQQAMR
jgi:hypothetical protein